MEYEGQWKVYEDKQRTPIQTIASRDSISLSLSLHHPTLKMFRGYGMFDDPYDMMGSRYTFSGDVNRAYFAPVSGRAMQAQEEVSTAIPYRLNALSYLL